MADVEETNSQSFAARRRAEQASAGPRGDADQTVQMAFDRSTSANESGTPTARVDAREQLQGAVDEARNVGVGWERIRAILGIARGNPYRRHRKHPKR